MAQRARCQKEEVKKKTWIIGMVVTFFFRMFELATDAVFSFMHRNTHKIALPPICNPLLLDSASSLAHKIRTQQVFCHLLIKYTCNHHIPILLINSTIFFISTDYQ